MGAFRNSALCYLVTIPNFRYVFIAKSRTFRERQLGLNLSVKHSWIDVSGRFWDGLIQPKGHIRSSC